MAISYPLFPVSRGGALHIESVGKVGLLGLGYISLRVVGRIIGGWVGGRIGKTDALVNRWIGIALLPQAGVAIAMVLLASQRFPETKDVLLPVVLGSTVFFELIGPILTRLALIRGGNIPPDKKHSSSV